MRRRDVGQLVVVWREEGVVVTDVPHNMEVEGDDDEEVDLPGQAEVHVLCDEEGYRRQEEGDTR